MLHVRPLKESDYDDFLCKWWSDWGFTPVPKDFLPDDGRGGVVVFDGDVNVCAGFMYATNSKVAWIDWIISNKEYRVKPERKEAIELLINTLTLAAKGSGHHYAYALIKNDKLVNTYKKLGYVVGVSYNEEMIKHLL